MRRYEYSDEIVNVVKQFLADDVRMDLFGAEGGET